MQDSLSQIDEVSIFCFQMITLEVPGDRKLWQSVSKAASWSGYIRLYVWLPNVPRVVLVGGWRLWEVAADEKSAVLLWAYAFHVVLSPRHTPRSSNWAAVPFAKKKKKIWSHRCNRFLLDCLNLIKTQHQWKWHHHSDGDGRSSATT